MKHIVKRSNQELTVSSIDIATYSNNEKKAVHQLISTHRKDLEEFGEINTISEEKFPHSKWHNLNEPQSYFLLTLMINSKAVVSFKKELIKQFFTLRANQLESKDKRIRKLQDHIYAKPRGDNFETVTYLINEYQINISAHELNEVLRAKGMLSVAFEKVPKYIAPVMSRGVPLVHEGMTLKLLDDIGIRRGSGYHDSHPTFQF